MPSTWSAWARFLPHALALDPAESRDPAVQRIGLDAIWYLIRHGDANAASDLARSLHRRWRVQLGPDHDHTWRAGSGLHVSLSMAGEYSAAREMGEDVLARRRRVLGDDHPDTLRSMGNLAYSLYQLGEHAAARKLAQDVLARQRRILGDAHPNAKRTEDLLSWIRQAMTKTGDD